MSTLVGVWRRLFGPVADEATCRARLAAVAEAAREAERERCARLVTDAARELLRRIRSGEDAT